MIEFPELHDALIEAARRRQAQRLPLARRLLRVVLPAVAVAAVAACVLIVVGLPGPDRERAVAPVHRSGDLLERRLGVFRRPRTAADELPGRSGRFGRIETDASRSRLVARRGEVAAYLVPGRRRGEPQLCAFLRLARDTGGGGCGPAHRLVRSTRAMTATTSPGRLRPGWFLAVFADGVEDVRLTLADGSVLRRPVRDNAVLVGSSTPVVALAWTDVDGHTHRQSERPTAGCPALDPLPPDAAQAAAEAAVAAAPGLYPRIRRATATSARPASASGWGGYAKRLCGDRVAARSIAVELRLVPIDPAARRSASLTQGRILLGVQDGRMQVWQVLH